MNARAQWQAALAQGRLHHAWLLSGRPGLGKRAFARSAAADLVGGHQDPSEHPDILTLERLPKDTKEERNRAEGKPFERKRNIAVDQIRSVQRRLTTRPTLGDRRAIVVDPAEAMEASAANALLKSLEEPPEGTFFFLVSDHAARLLPTIRSRCRILRFGDLDDAEVSARLAAEMPGLDPDTAREAVATSGGSPGRALAFAEHKLAPAAKLLERMLQGQAGSGGADLAAALGARPSRDKMAAFLTLARSMLGADIARLDRATLDRRASVMAELVELEREAPILNYDPGLLIQRVASLLASAAPASEQAQ